MHRPAPAQPGAGQAPAREAVGHHRRAATHQHSVVAERFGLLGELRRDGVARFTTLREWLDG